MFFKSSFYDWFGLNQTAQQYLHHLTEHEIYRRLMTIGSNYIGEYKLFPIHLAIIATILAIVVHRLNNKLSKSSLTKYHSQIISSGYVLFISLIICALLIELSKRCFSMPRPFCAHSLLSQIAIAKDCFRSFPSGHTSYVTILTCSLWPLLNTPFKITAAAMAILVFVSRISLDYHYPADVLYSMLFSMTVVFFISKYVDKISSHFSSINYHAIRLLTKL